MRIADRWETQEIAKNGSFDIDFKYFIMHYRKCIAISYYSLVIDTTLKSDIPPYLVKNLTEENWRVIMTTDEKNKNKIKMKNAVWH